MTLYYGVLLSAFAFGAIIGSFLNVCIYRIPAGLSIISPASRCPGCLTPIRCWQNIPILSWLVLRGRCAVCKSPISWRYPAVEFLTGALFVLVLNTFGLSWGTPVYWLFTAALVTITLIDFDHQIIPDVISLPGIAAGLVASLLLPWLPFLDSLIGVVLGGGILYAIAAGYELLTKREGMGGGDIKLLAMIGAFLGWKAILPIVFLSSLLGTVIAVPMMALKGADRRFAIPFGPFLAAAAFIYLLWGQNILHWYLNLIGGVS